MIDVLIVEDDAATRRLYRFLLTNSGFTVAEAADGVSALEQIAHKEFFIVITDMNMPRMGGIDLTRLIRQRAPNELPFIIMVTAFGTPDTEANAYRAGVNEYLNKPFDFEDLEQRVIKVIRRTETQRKPQVGAENLEILSSRRGKSQKTILTSIKQSVRKALLRARQRQHIPAVANKTRFNSHIADNRHTILVVDDDATFLCFLQSTLSQHDYIVHTATDGKKALQATSEQHYDLIITDIMMPNMNGMELIKTLRQSNPYIKIIATTSNDRVFHEVMTQGSCSFVLKPFRIKELIQTIQFVFLMDDAYTMIKEGYQQKDITLVTTALILSQNADNTVLQWTPFLPSVHAIVPLSTNQHLVLLSTENLNSIIDKMIEVFYAGPLIQAYPSAILSFGIAAGSSPSVDAMIETAARDLIERSESQGMPLQQEPEILRLQPWREQLSMRAVFARHRLTELNAQDSDLDTREQMRMLTARFRHDLVGNLLRIRAMIDNTRQLVPSEQIIHFTRLEQQVAICLETLESMRQAIEPRNSAGRYGLILSLAELKDEVAVLEQQLDEQERLQTERQARHEQASLALARARELLLPFVDQLIQQVQMLTNHTRTLLKDVDETREATTRINRAAQFCALLTLNLARVVQGETAQAESVDIHAAIYDVCNMLTPLLEERDVRYDLAETTPIVQISPVEIRQVLTNLIVNAAEATQIGERIMITTTIREGNVLLRIVDTGFGIPPENQAKIFQLNFSTKGRGTDSGIGLYIVETIMHQIGGQVGIASATRHESGALHTWSSGLPAGDRPHWQTSGTFFQLTLPCNAGA